MAPVPILSLRELCSQFGNEGSGLVKKSEEDNGSFLIRSSYCQIFLYLFTNPNFT